MKAIDWSRVTHARCPQCDEFKFVGHGPLCGDCLAGGTGFVTKDSGERVDFPSGMRRDTDKGKPRYDLIPLPMLTRLAELYARGAEKYGDSNWTLANSQAEVDRFKASAFRHFISWMSGELDEDHAVAVVFNIFAADTIQAKIQ